MKNKTAWIIYFSSFAMSIFISIIGVMLSSKIMLTVAIFLLMPALIIAVYGCIRGYRNG